MAKATLAGRPDVVLTLTADEAQALAIVTGAVGGSQGKSPRRFIDAIGEALAQLGISDYTDAEYHGRFVGKESSIYFNDGLLPGEVAVGKAKK